ncbi:tetratricopeptide repeat protein [Methylomonas sp. MgM2]
MNNRFLLALVPLISMVSGCSTVSDQQPPRPVAKVVKPSQPAPQKKPQTKKTPPPVAKKTAPDTATYPIDDGKGSIKIESNVPEIRIDPLAPPVEIPAATGSATTDNAVQHNSIQGNSIIGNAVAAPPPPAFPPYTIEDVHVPTGTSPAVVALLTEADRNRASGNLSAAVVATERALRIDSRNPTLTYKLAQLRIKQNKPQLAEELAGKAALLAGNNLELKRKSWLLIAEARRMQQNYQGAKQAQFKAESFYGR